MIRPQASSGMKCLTSAEEFFDVGHLPPSIPRTEQKRALTKAFQPFKGANLLFAIRLLEMLFDWQGFALEFFDAL